MAEENDTNAPPIPKPLGFEPSLLVMATLLELVGSIGIFDHFGDGK